MEIIFFSVVFFSIFLLSVFIVFFLILFGGHQSNRYIFNVPFICIFSTAFPKNSKFQSMEVKKEEWEKENPIKPIFLLLFF